MQNILNKFFKFKGVGFIVNSYTFGEIFSKFPTL